MEKEENTENLRNTFEQGTKKKDFVRAKVEKILSIKLIRFFLVAGLNTAFGYMVFASFIFFGLHYTLATLLGQIIGVLFNFNTYGSLVFKNKKNRLIFKFVGVYALTYGLNIGSMTLLKHFFGFSDYLAAAIMVIPIGLFGFVLNKRIVFKS